MISQICARSRERVRNAHQGVREEDEHSIAFLTDPRIGAIQA